MDTDYYNNAAGAAIAAFFVIYIVVLLIAVAIGYVLTALSLMTFFKKVGVEPWIAWVPIYNNWKWLEVGGQQGWLALLQLVYGAGIVTSVFIYIGMHRTGIAFGKQTGFLVLGIFLPFVWAFILGGQGEVYRPELIAAAGYAPPLAGYGSVPKEQRQASYPGPTPPAPPAAA